MRRLHLTRALLAGMAAVLAGAIAAYALTPLLVGRRFDPIGWLARQVLARSSDDEMLAGAVGWLLAILAGEVIALVFAALWDLLPPRTRPVTKSVVYCALLFLVFQAPLVAAPAAMVFAAVLGAAYRPHPAPPETPRRAGDAPVRSAVIDSRGRQRR